MPIINDPNSYVPAIISYNNTIINESGISIQQMALNEHSLAEHEVILKELRVNQTHSVSKNQKSWGV